MKLVVGTRGSELALSQTQWVIDRIKEKHPKIEFEIEVIKTKGDKILYKSIEKIGGKGVFVKEIEDRLLHGKIDMAIHSLKDMPSYDVEGLKICDIPLREDPRDVIVFRDGINCIDELPENARIGTGSKRRAYQLQSILPKAEFVSIRGNIRTRIEKIKKEGLDAVVIAAAGVKRLGLEDVIGEYLSVDRVIPSPGQGALAIQIRVEDKEIEEIVNSISDEVSHLCSTAERAFMKGIDGSCHIPMGAYCEVLSDGFKIIGVYGSENGDKLVYKEIEEKFAKEGDGEECVTLDFNKGYEKVNPPQKIIHRIDKINQAKKLGHRLANEIIDKFKEENSMDRNKYGKVYLVGAGPGDFGLMTIKGLEVLRNSDVVIYDRLANEEFLRETKDGCELIYVGKKASIHIVPQDDINELIIKKAKEGKMVTRLKGGDPYVFGRGGEEAERIYDEGIEFEVIPGVTSAIGGLAYSGIPITHRDFASSFHVITGHPKHGGDDNINWSGLAKMEGTLVFLMGLKNISHISKRLIENGMDRNTPAALISWATWHNQRSVVSTLENLESDVKKHGLTSPTLIVVGGVVGLKDKLNFFERRPLFGLNIGVTRSRTQNSKTVRQIMELGANPVEMPTIKIKELESYKEVDKKIIEIRENKSNKKYIVFNSVNGVEVFFKRLKVLRLDSRFFSDLTVCSIGSVTSESLEKHGIIADIEPQKYTSESLSSDIEDEVKKGDFIYVISSDLSRKVIEKRLGDLCKVETLELYHTVLNSEDANKIIESLRGELDYIIFTSSSTVKNLVDIIGDKKILLEDIKTVSIGPITTNTMEELGIRVDMEAKEATISSMIKSIIDNR